MKHAGGDLDGQQQEDLKAFSADARREAGYPLDLRTARRGV
jgi:hypothetical protein